MPYHFAEQQNWHYQLERSGAPSRARRQAEAKLLCHPNPRDRWKPYLCSICRRYGVAVDRQGKIVWKNQEVSFHSLHGLGASPILSNGRVVMPFDGSSRDQKEVGWKVPWDQAVLLAIDSNTGKTVWRGKRGASRVGHVTPITTNDGKHVISAAGDRVQAFESNTGKLVWSVYSQGEGVTPTPALGDGIIFTSSGFEEPTIRAIRLNGEGDVTDTHIEWEQKKGVPAMPSPLLVGPIFTPSPDNILCIAVSSGKSCGTNASTERIRPLRFVMAEFIFSRASNDGDPTGAKFVELANNPLDEKCLASMAVSGGQLFIRGIKHLFCIGNAE